MNSTLRPALLLFFRRLVRAGLPIGLLLTGGARGSELPRLDPTNLMIYRDSQGAIVPVVSVADWQKRRTEILAGMQVVMGPLPGTDQRCPLDVQVEEETDFHTYVMRRLTYASGPGARVPAYLLIPKAALNGQERVPAVLCLHPTDDIGYAIAVGLGGRPNRNYGSELAERGYVTLCPAYPLLSNYQPDLKALGFVSGTMKAIWDNIRGIDLLTSLPYVKAEAIGAIGHSLGGHNAIFTAVFDDRIKVIVSSSGFDSFADYQGGHNIKGWAQSRYMPRIAAYPADAVPFDFYELIGALAPRMCFISAPRRDENFNWWSVDKIVRSAYPIYQLYHFPERLQVVHPDTVHDFPIESRVEAYRILDRYLR